MLNVAKLKEVFPTDTFDVDTVLYQQGDESGDGFIIQQGQVELTSLVDGQEIMVATFYANEVFGIYKTLFDNDRRGFTATVKEKSIITRIPAQFLIDRINASDSFIIHCFRQWPNLEKQLRN